MSETTVKLDPLSDSAYVPEDHDILEAYVSMMSGRLPLAEFMDGNNPVWYRLRFINQFHRWLTEHDRRMMEKAWDAAKESYDQPNPYRKEDK